MADALFIGVDLGTSALKCGVWDADGTCHGRARVGHATHGSEGRAEQRAEDWWAALLAGLHDACAAVDTSRVAAIAVGGHAPSPAFVDDALTPVAPVLTWLDRRADDDVAVAFAALGGRPDDGPSRLAARVAARAAWTRRAAPEAFARARLALHAWEYLIARLCGGWPGGRERLPAFAALDLPEALAAASGPPPGGVAGTLAPAVAGDLGLPVGTPVVTGGLDSFLGAVGSGIREAGEACINAGSSSVVACLRDPPASGRFALGGRVMASVPAGPGGALLARVFAGHVGPSEALIEAALSLDAPTLSPFEVASQDAPTRLDALVSGHGPALALRLVLDGIVEAERGALADIAGTPHRLRLVGGQAGSPALARHRADAFGCRVQVPECPDSGALGAAMLAALGVNALPDPATAAHRMVRVARVYAPRRSPAASNAARSASDSSA